MTIVITVLQILVSGITFEKRAIPPQIIIIKKINKKSLL